MSKIQFHLTELNFDPEERFEEAALWKAMKDEYGDEISPITKSDLDRDPSLGEKPTFGRALSNPFINVNHPVSEIMPYWTDQAFLKHCNRAFSLTTYKNLVAACSKLQRDGHDVFLKSTRPKHYVERVAAHEDPIEVMSYMAYSFIDTEVLIMVQQFCTVQYEHRFFVIDREIITSSPVQTQLTPLDYNGMRAGSTYEKPNAPQPVYKPDVVEALHDLASKVAKEMQIPHASVDCAIINGRPAVIEFNPMRLGQLGLYACDVRALAKASRKLLS
jgi:ATP-grasp domain, R2K clade family 2